MALYMVVGDGIEPTWKAYETFEQPLPQPALLDNNLLGNFNHKKELKYFMVRLDY